MNNINTLNKPDSQLSDGDEIDMRFILIQLRRNYKILTASLVFGFLIGLFLYFSSPRKFTAHTTLMINVEGEAAAAQAAKLVKSLSGAKLDGVASALAVANSTALLEQVVDAEHLVEVSEFNTRLRDPSWKTRIFSLMRLVTTWIKSKIDVGETLKLGEEEWSKPDVLERRRAINALQERVRIIDLQDDLRLRISVTTQSRVRSAAIADTMAIKLNGFLRATKTAALKNAQNWIEREVKRVKTTIGDIEDNIEIEISQGNVLPGTETLGENAQRLVEGELLLEKNKRRGVALNRLGEVIMRIEAGESAQVALVEMPDDIRTELIVDYPDVFQWEKLDESPSRAEILATKRLVKHDLEIQYSTIFRRQQEILPVRAYTRKMSSAKNRYLQLETQYKANVNLLRTLQERLAELQIESAGEVQHLTVLEAAVPPLRHAKPSLILSIALGSFLGLSLGLLITLRRSFKRDSFHSLEDVEETFGAPAVSIVSDIHKKFQKRFAWTELPDEIQEAYRRAYSAVFIIQGEQSTRSLMVTSSIPAEGKTTASLYLAAAAVEGGKKTLVIDLDFRKRSVSRYLGLKRTLGCFSIFRGEATFDEAVLPYIYNENSFDVLTTDGWLPNSKETLSASNVRRLIEEANNKYDVIIIDVPPILAVQDANIAGKVVDNILCVVSTRDLQKKAAQRAAKEWQRAGNKLFGLIVRGESSELHNYYGYGYYHYSYAEDEDSKRLPSQRLRNKSKNKKVGRHPVTRGNGGVTTRPLR